MKPIEKGQNTKRPFIEHALCFDIAELNAQGCLVPNTLDHGILQKFGRLPESVEYRISLDDDAGDCWLIHDADNCPYRYKIKLETTPLPWGGLRWWLVCPYTGKRARKLYKFRHVEKFCHREALTPQPTYASQRNSGINRAVDQRFKLRRKVRDDVSNLFEPLCRPKGMHHRTFQRHVYRDQQLAARDMGFMIAKLQSWGVKIAAPYDDDV